ncbi:uncharacterized protein LOC126855596 [Cataglyphis hispanica]|uniref:uncharacterized protein LOC126855596 n=1 Tax=Cataglyphis hispanica TaxID=1086592 RepID=UPI0021809A07|nr:uncharacterized protein LOC126855596 [Cataglyphis hispanica]
MNMPKTKILLEEQLTIVAQYFQPHVSYWAIKTWLNEIAFAVLSRLMEKYPAHSIFSATSKQLSFWRNNNIHDNFWNKTESKQILCILEEYIFSKLNIYRLLITLNLKAKYIKHFTESFIDRKHLLTITYHIVARRLGVCCYLIKYKDNIGIMWKPKYNTSIGCNTEFFYLSPSPNLFYPLNVIRQLYRNNNVFFSAPVHLFSHISITRFIMSNYLLKYHQKYCRDFNIIFILLYRYFAVDKPINIENIYEMIIDTIEVNSEKGKKSVKRRTKEIKFAVGMVVRHRWTDHFSNSHDGVIIGWHDKCDEMFLNKIKSPFLLPF